ncbi:uncharacterized protein LOC118187572 isoform X1 [Stegodyphus dumicola]|uniref:uncharacterized protein LOC118187572 isoform X1 n=1 Tax=Stegodyphus dumicola TaxID=202533 RepID=UPI0015A92149|nr:uncharacterized protein LOC118187572 isoform X1 [Stegodyphus dumicola]
MVFLWLKREKPAQSHKTKWASTNKHRDQYDEKSKIPSTSKQEDATKDKSSTKNSAENLNFADQDFASHDEPSQNSQSHKTKWASTNKHHDQHDGKSKIPSTSKEEDVKNNSAENLNFADQDFVSHDEPSQNYRHNPLISYIVEVLQLLFQEFRLTGYNSPSGIYCISNSSNFNCGPTFINVIKGSASEKVNSGVTSNKLDRSRGRPIKVRKGVFDSKRIISDEDIQVVSQYIADDWKILIKSLPGITSYSSSFHQSLIDALDSQDDVNLAELALLKWKETLPQVSNIGNLAKILFSIDHPDVVTILNP